MFRSTTVIFTRAIGFVAAMFLPGLSTPGQLPIVIGVAGVKAGGLQTPLPALSTGEGLVQSIDTAGAHALVIAGGDDAGTRAAAEWFAGRLPHVWDPSGTT